MNLPPGKYRIGAFRPFMPDWARFAIIFAMALVFQLSQAVYLGNLGEMVGATGLTAEDVRLLAGASFCGTTMVFPLLFRIKFRFMSRTILVGCSAVVLLGNLVTMTSTCLPLLLAVSFLVGVFKMIGTFECMSSMQLVVTPKRDLAVFFCFLYPIILGSVQLSGLLSAWCADHGDWRRMHLAIAAAHAAMILLLALTLRPFRFIKRLPLYQVDWLSFALWSAVLLLLDFVLEYGRRLDWLDSAAIRGALAAALALAACTVFRMFTAKRPLIAPAVFCYRNLLVAILLYAGMQLLLGPTNVILPALTAGVLHYDGLHIAALNWAFLGGIALGTAGSYHWLVVCRGGFKTIIAAAFLCLVLGLLALQPAVAPSIPQAAFHLPAVLRAAGYTILYIALTIYTVQQVPFLHFIPSLALVGIVRTAIGGTAANALASQVLEHFAKIHRSVLGQGLDPLNDTAAALRHGVQLGVAAHGGSPEQAAAAATGALYGKVQLQALLVSWKDLLGWWSLLGLLLLAGLLSFRYVAPTLRRMPSFRQLAAALNPLPHVRRGLRVLADS